MHANTIRDLKRIPQLRQPLCQIIDITGDNDHDEEVAIVTLTSSSSINTGSSSNAAGSGIHSTPLGSSSDSSLNRTMPSLRRTYDQANEQNQISAAEEERAKRLRLTPSMAGSSTVSSSLTT